MMRGPTSSVMISSAAPLTICRLFFQPLKGTVLIVACIVDLVREAAVTTPKQATAASSCRAGPRRMRYSVVGTSSSDHETQIAGAITITARRLKEQLHKNGQELGGVYRVRESSTSATIVFARTEPD